MNVSGWYEGGGEGVGNRGDERFLKRAFIRVDGDGLLSTLDPAFF